MFHANIIRNPADLSPEIRDFFYQHPPSFFQGPDFLNLLSETEGFKPFIIVLSRDRKIVATLAGANIREGKGIKARVSERTVIYGHPVIAEGHDPAATITKLLESLKKVSGTSLFTQFRNDVDQENVKEAFAAAGFRRLDRLNLIKPIHNIDEAWAGLSDSRKRQITSSLKNGATIIDQPDTRMVEDFYNQLLDLYKTKVRKPLPRKSFFLRFHKLCQAGTIHGRIILCLYNGRVIGGILCPFTPRGSIYEWYVCGLDQTFRAQKIYPSVLVTWAAMQAGNKLGCTDFDFMGLGIPSRPYGVRDFKARFGGNWVNHGRWSRVTNPMLYAIAELGYNVLRVLKKV